MPLQQPPILRVYETLLRGNTSLWKHRYIKVLEWRLDYVIQVGSMIKDKEKSVFVSAMPEKSQFSLKPVD